MSAPAIPRDVRPDRGGQDARSRSALAERTAVIDRQRRLAPALSRLRRRHGEADARRARSRVPHRGIDVLEPTERASAAWWASSADAWIRRRLRARTRAVRRRRNGTLSPRAVRRAVRRAAARRRPARRRSSASWRRYDTEELRRWVRDARSGARHARPHAAAPRDRDRAAHRPARERSPPRAARARRWRARYLVVDPGPELATRIEARVAAMLEAGWREEVRGLMRPGPGGRARPGTPPATARFVRSRAASSPSGTRSSASSWRRGSTPSGSAPGSGTSSPATT